MTGGRATFVYSCNVAKSAEGLDWLYLKMEELGMTSLEDAARVTGINRGTLYRYFSFETRPSIDVLPKLCEGLKATPLEVLRALGIQ